MKLTQLTQLVMIACIITLSICNLQLKARINNYKEDDSRRAFVMAAYEVNSGDLTAENDTVNIKGLFGVENAK